RLRKECPNAECGAGTFMANHFDRHYCGKCGLTYVYQKAGAEHLVQCWCTYPAQQPDSNPHFHIS
ncbi:Small ribosomal subunit protein eS31 - like 2, partial [Theobroma cacao]